MRKFYLYIDGNKKELNGKNGIYFANPQGLGANLAPPMVNLRNGFFKPAADDFIPQSSITGDLIFRPYTFEGLKIPAYTSYSLFIDRFLAASEMEIGYNPDPLLEQEYRMKVRLDYLNKSELQSGCLICPVGFIPLTPWYRDKPATFDLSQDDENYFSVTSTIFVNGSLPAAFSLSMDGGTPYIITAGPQGETGSGTFILDDEAQISTRGLFEYSTRYDDSYARFTKGNTVIDLVDRVFINEYITNIFPRLKPNTTNVVSVLYRADTSIPVDLSISVREYYRSV